MKDIINNKTEKTIELCDNCGQESSIGIYRRYNS